MQEMVSSLTENKLRATTRIDELENSLTKVRQQLEHSESAVIENESLKRQIKRLTDENDGLLSDMQLLEKQIQVTTLPSVDKTAVNLELAKAQQELTAKAEQITKLEHDSAIERQTLTAQSKALTKKLALYRAKILDVAGKVKQLKKGKEILSETVNDYSKAVSKWQLEIVTVSGKLIEKIHGLQREKTEFQVRISKLAEENNLLAEQLDRVQQNFEQHSVTIASYKALEHEYNERLQTISNDQTHCRLQLSELNETYRQKSDHLIKLQQKCLAHFEKIRDHNNLKLKYDEVGQRNECLEAELAAKLARFEEMKQELKEKSNESQRCKEFEEKYNQLLAINEKCATDLQVKLDADNRNKSQQLLGGVELELQETARKFSEFKDLSENCERELQAKIMELEGSIQLKNDAFNAFKHSETSKYEDVLRSNENLTTDLEICAKKHQASTNKLLAMEKDRNELQERHQFVEDQIRITSVQLDEAKQQIRLLQDDAKDCTDSATQNCSKLEEKLQNATAELTDKTATISTLTFKLADQVEVSTGKSKEIDELLGEMREINEALKNRGDIISRQEAKIIALKSEMKNDRKRIGELQSNYTEREQTLAKLSDVAAECEKSHSANGKTMFTFHFQILSLVNLYLPFQTICLRQPYQRWTKPIECVTSKIVSRRNTINCVHWPLNLSAKLPNNRHTLANWNRKTVKTRTRAYK